MDKLRSHIEAITPITDAEFEHIKSFFALKKVRKHQYLIEDGEVLCLKLEGRETLSADMHKMEHFFRIKLTGGYAALQRRIISLLAGTPQERYEEFCDLYPKFVQKMPKKYIAEYLGCSRETLSRLYSK